MTTSPSPIRFSAPRHTTAEISAKKAQEYESVAQLVEDLIPNFKKQAQKQFYREVVQSYRAAARNILRRAWLDDKVVVEAVWLSRKYCTKCSAKLYYKHLSYPA